MRSTIILYLLFLSFGLQAQLSLTGKLTDPGNQALVLADVLLLVNDSIAASTLTDEEGSFNLRVAAGDYQLQVKQFGVLLYEQVFSIKQDLALGTLVITNESSDNKIEEVVMQEKKKLIEQKSDRLIFNVENSIAASGGTVLDALKITPGVQMQDETLSLSGKGSVKVMIDDRMVQLSGEELHNFLQSISSDHIQSIEIITAPPAQYDAEGNSGLINIKYKKGRKNAWSNTLRSSYQQATYGSYSLGNTFNYQKDKLSLFADLNFNRRHSIYTNTSNYILNCFNDSEFKV